jgi:hypothetical protein
MIWAAIFVLAPGRLRHPAPSAPVRASASGRRLRRHERHRRAPVRRRCAARPSAEMIGLGLFAHALFGIALAFTAARLLRTDR